MAQHIHWKTLWWTFGVILALLVIGFWLGIVPVADASDHQSGVIEPADIPPAVGTAPVQNEHWTDIPPVPARAPDVERIGQCGTMGDGTELSFVVRLWRAERYAQYLSRVNEVVGTVMATLIFPEGDDDGVASAIYVSLPGRAVERMTGPELMRAWPHPCLMAQAVVGTRT